MCPHPKTGSLPHALCTALASHAPIISRDYDEAMTSGPAASTSSSPRPDTPTGRVLVVSTGRDRGSLAAVRALHRAGWTVGVGTPGGRGMLASTSACTRAHAVERPRGDGLAFIDGVRSAVSEGNYDVVFGAGDDWMAALSLYRDHLDAQIAHPSWDAVVAALDKVSLSRAASAVGLDVPRTEPATADVIASWDGPVVVKSRSHWQPGQSHPLRIEARRFPDIRSAQERMEHLRSHGIEPILQAPVDGRLMALIGLFYDGRLDGRVQQVSPRIWPTPTGVSARAETVPVDDQLAARAERLLERLGWEGLVELQFLQDASGTAHLIDLNGRFYGSMALAETARPGIAHSWAQRTLGHSSETLADGRSGHRYSWAAADLRRAWVERRGGLLRDAADTVRWAATARHSVWDWTDLGPTLRLVGERLRPGIR